MQLMPEPLGSSDEPRRGVRLKDTFADILHVRMQKCTSEQFWAVATVSGMQAFAMLESPRLLEILLRWLIIFALTLVTAYAVSYIFHRHVVYYRRRQLVALIADEEQVPPELQTCRSPWSPRALMGCGFYAGWLILLWAMNIIAYSRAAVALSN